MRIEHGGFVISQQFRAGAARAGVELLGWQWLGWQCVASFTRLVVGLFFFFRVGNLLQPAGQVSLKQHQVLPAFPWNMHLAVAGFFCLAPDLHDAVEMFVNIGQGIG